MNETSHEQTRIGTMQIPTATGAPEYHAGTAASDSPEHKRQQLCAALQANRRLIAKKLVGEVHHTQFPRSAIMRFIANHNAREIVHKAANAALGLQTFKALRRGLSLFGFMRRGFKRSTK